MAAHRWWRMFITVTASGSNAGCNEIELRETTGGADRTGSGTAAASGAYSGWPASQAVDNNNGTGWTTFTTGGSPWWWAYDFGAGNAFDIRELYILPRQDGFHNEAPSNFNWQYSDDGTNWTTQRSLTGINWPGAAAQVIDVAPPPPPKFEPVDNQPFRREVLHPYRYTAWTQITGRWNITGAVWAAGQSPAAMLRRELGGVLYGAAAADFTGTGGVTMMTMLAGRGAAAALRISGTGTVE